MTNVKWLQNNFCLLWREITDVSALSLCLFASLILDVSLTGCEGSERQSPDEEEVRVATGRLHHQSSRGSQESWGVPDSQSGGSLTRGGTPSKPKFAPP